MVDMTVAMTVEQKGAKTGLMMVAGKVWKTAGSRGIVKGQTTALRTEVRSDSMMVEKRELWMASWTAVLSEHEWAAKLVDATDMTTDEMTAGRWESPMVAPMELLMAVKKVCLKDCTMVAWMGKRRVGKLAKRAVAETVAKSVV